MEGQYHKQYMVSSDAAAMKIRLIIYLISAIFIALHAIAAEPFDNWGPVSNKVQMSISLKDGEKFIRTNQDFKLLVRIKNLSESNVYTYNALDANSDPYQGVYCTITSPSGQNFSPNKKNNGDSGVFIHIRPGTVEAFEFDLGSVHKFDEVGDYKITAKKLIATQDNKAAWTSLSNPLVVKVVSTNGEITNGPPPIDKAVHH